MKRLLFAFLAILVITTGSVNAQGLKTSGTVKVGPLSYTVDSNGNSKSCLSGAGQKVCITHDSEGRNNGVEVSAKIPVSPGGYVTGDFSYSEGGKVNGCVGTQVGVPKLNAGIKNCVGHEPGSTYIHSSVYGNAGPMGVGYNTSRLEIKQRDPNAPRVPDNPWMHPKY